MNIGTIPRRRFLKAAVGATGLAVTGAAAAGVHLGTQAAVPMALIGSGVRGEMLCKTFTRRLLRSYGDMRVVCDVDRSQADRVMGKYCPQADYYDDYRKVLEREDLRAVVVATPDHWHAKITIEALRAGKAVYCEKPISLTIDEGKQVRQAVEETGGLLLIGTQQRSDTHFHKAIDLIHNGRLGKIKRITVQLHENPVGGPFANSKPPEGFNWEMWLGQTPYVDYCHQRCYDKFQLWYEYAGGEITNWGAHHVDFAQWAMQMDHSGPLTIDGEGVMPQVENGYNVAQKYRIEMTYPDDMQLRIVSHERKGILVEGERGRIFVNREVLEGQPFEDLKNNPLPEGSSRSGHLGRYWEVGSSKNVHVQHFLDCVLTGYKPISDAATSHRSATVCHLANLCLRLGRRLEWDPQRELFVGDEEANSMLARAQRDPYKIA